MKDSLSPIPLTKLPEKLTEGEFDAFIFCGSYEDRCLKIGHSFSRKVAKKVYVCQNENPHEKTSVNLRRAEEHFGDVLRNVTLSKSDPIKTIDALIEHLSEYKVKQSRILVDITCFTHENLLILQKVIRHLDIKTTYAYCPAEAYNPRTKRDEDKWLSRGIGEVRSVLGYPGTRDPLKRSHLIVLVGFEVERARKLIDRYEPAHLSLGYAEDEISDGAGERNRKRFEELMSQYSEAKEFTFSARDIQKTKEAIFRQINQFNEANPLIAPMNTKLSTLALAQAAQEEERIQICYASALLYNVEDYSEPKDECYLFSLAE